MKNRDWKRLQGEPKAEAEPIPKVNFQNFLRERASNRESMAELNLTGWPFLDADLSGVHFWSCNFDRVKFGAANVAGARFSDCSLRYCDLSEVVGLTTGELAGSDLEGATLPDEIGGFDELNTVEELSKNVGKVLLGLFGAVAFCLSTVGGTRAESLFLGIGTVKLPLFNADVSYAAFYVLAPVILLAAFVYMHLYLQKLWETVSKMPAVFQDGRRLDERSYPWLLNDFGLQYFPRLRKRLPPLHGLQSALYAFLAWWAIPVVLLPFPITTFYRHSAALTTFQFCLIGLSVWISITFRDLAVSTLSWRSQWLTHHAREQAQKRRRVWIWLAVCQIPMIVCFALADTCFTKKTDLNDVVPGLSKRYFAHLMRSGLEALGCDLDANLSGLNLSISHAEGPQKGDDSTSGPVLRHLDLINADLSFTSVPAVDLSHSNLGCALLHHTRMPNASIDGTDFTGADLSFADMSSAQSVRVISQDDVLSWIRGVNDTGMANREKLQASIYRMVINHPLAETEQAGPNFGASTLRETDLSNSRLLNANFDRAQFIETNLDQSMLVTPSFADCYFHGVQAANAEFANSSFLNALFDDCKFQKTDLDRSVFRGCSFRNGNFSEGSIEDGRLIRSSFEFANFDNFGFYKSTLDHCNIKDCSFVGTSIDAAYIYGSMISGGDFTDATFEHTTFRDCTIGTNLRNCSWAHSNIQTSNYVKGQRSLRMTIRGLPESNRNVGTFDSAEIRHTGFISINISEKTFPKALLDGCQFTDCHIVGSMKHVTFCNMDVGVIDPKLGVFDDCVFDSCVLPSGPGYRYINCSAIHVPTGFVPLPGVQVVRNLANRLPMAAPLEPMGSAAGARFRRFQT